MNDSVPILRAAALTKRFGGLLANDAVDFTLERGEIHALVGENGAGKSTLMNMLFGMIRPDSGSIEIDGTPARIHSVKDAIAAGIGMVHQHFMLVPEFTVERNVTLGAEPQRMGFLDASAGRRALAEASRLIGFDVDPGRRACELSVADQQRVEILKVLYRGARIVILDEPTAVLTPQETEELFRTLRKLAAGGVAVVFITHKLWEVREVADRVTVLRQGRTHGTFRRGEADIPALVGLMTGRTDVSLGRIERPAPGEQSVLSVAGLRGRALPDGPLREASFEVRAGEVLGVAGVDGNGQNSLVSLLTGGADGSGRVLLDGRPIEGETIARRRAAGVAHVPEDRHRDGLPLRASVVEGLVADRLSRRRGLRLFGGAITGTLRDWAQGVVERFGIKTASLSAPAASLSGGNQQKIVLARELDSRPRLLVLAQPTRGVDIGAAEGIYRAVAELSATGSATIVVSADLDELMRLSDRIIVLYRGRIVAEFAAAETSREELGMAMAGGYRREAA
ncbi:MAG: ABC transporter ATP-binding protein [Leucobacter sp.]